MIVSALGVQQYTKALYKCIIHSFIHSFIQGARVEPEGRTSEDPAEKKPWRIARAGPVGRTRKAPA